VVSPDFRRNASRLLQLCGREIDLARREYNVIDDSGHEMFPNRGATPSGKGTANAFKVNDTHE
jgi:hypothetical protein